MKAHMQTDLYKSGMRQTSASKSITIFFVSQKDDNAQFKIAAVELTWAYHTNRHALSYRSLDCSIKLSKVTFLDSDVVTKMSCAQTKGEILITDVLAPYIVQLRLADLAKDYAFYIVLSDTSNHVKWPCKSPSRYL